jgi:hypothetical protein
VRGSGPGVFSGASFLLTGIDSAGERGTTDNNKARLERQIAGAGGKCLEIPRDAQELHRRLSAGERVVFLADPPQGKPVKVSMTTMIGLAHALVPTRPSWVAECLSQARWLPIAPSHLVPLSGDASAASSSASSSSRVSSRRQPPPPAALRAELLGGYTLVLAGSKEWLDAGWAALPRAAGSEVRLDLPPKHHSGGGEPAAKHCLVLVENDASRAAVGGLLERARARSVPAASQDWLKHCLLQQQQLDVSRYPPKVTAR